MTNKEAADELKCYHYKDGTVPEEIILAIKALENARPIGEWIIVDDCEHFIAKCSICGRIEDSRMVQNYPFCRCGAEMEEAEE